MEFVLWVSRIMHGLSAAVWLGGLIFLNAVLQPVLRHEEPAGIRTAVITAKRYMPFVWFSVWTLLVTGLFLAILSPRFAWMELSTPWSLLLLAKEILFILVLFFSWQMKKVVRRFDEAIGGKEADVWWRTFEVLTRRSITAGLALLLSATGMAVV